VNPRYYGGRGNLFREAVMTQDEAVDLIRQLLRAQNEAELMKLVSKYLSAVDGTFFTTAEAAAQELERTGKTQIASALRSLTDRMLRMKTLI
jgi:hypothetical protein